MWWIGCCHIIRRQFGFEGLCRVSVLVFHSPSTHPCHLTFTSNQLRAFGRRNISHPSTGPSVLHTIRVCSWVGGGGCHLQVSHSLLSYLYIDPNPLVLRNKFSHTLTLFFLCTYIDQWPTFFSDLFTLIRPTDTSAFNRHISLLFFHIVLEISGEVADQMIKSARPYDADRHARDGRVRDAVRERDAARINEAVLTLVAEGSERMANLRKRDDSSRELDGAIEVVDWGIRTFGSYVGELRVKFRAEYLNEPFSRLDRH